MAIIAECEWCNSEYDAKRSTSRFCGPKCKQAFYRNRMKGVTVTEEARSVTVTAKPKRNVFTKLVLEGMTKGVTVTGSGARVIPKRGKDIKCFEDLPADVQQAVNMMSMVNDKIDQTIKANRTAIAIHYQHIFPGRYEPTDAVCSGVVTGKPGDADYNGICTEEWRAERGR